MKKGFTLIELLVVIVIIGILATLATVALSSARMKARDARRVSDVKQIMTALEMYYNEAGGYPTVAAGSGIATSLLSPLVYNGNTYMAKVPSNASPIDEAGTPGAGLACNNTSPNSVYSVSTTYAYTPFKAQSTDLIATTYSIMYCLGGQTGTIPAGLNTASPAGITSR